MKKKKTVLFTILFILLPITAYGVNYTLTSATYSINVNGQKLAVQPLNLNGTTYLPIRSISEAVGVPIEWDNTTRSVNIDTLDVDRLKESCIKIKASDGETYEQGSAVAWDYGEFLTAYHAVDEGRTTVTDFGQTSFTVDRYSEILDISVLKSNKEIKPVKIGDSDDVRVGDQVIVIGAPEGKEDTVIYTTVKRLTSDIVIDKATNGGSSGAGLFNVRGELIGIVVAGSVGSSESYVIPINTIRKPL
jgi:S1-C subfamily serine protease